MNLKRLFSVLHSDQTGSLPAVQEVGSLGWEDSLEKTMATHTPGFLPGEFHGQRSLVDYYSPWGCKELDMTD